MPKLTDAQRKAFADLPRGVATLSDDDLGRTLAEPHPSWVPRLEAAWIERYASGK
jgi:putative thiamine transport system substrate-binding protein